MYMYVCVHVCSVCTCMYVYVSSSGQAVGVGEREGETFSDLSRRTISISSAEGESPGKRRIAQVRPYPPSHKASMKFLCIVGPMCEQEWTHLFVQLAWLTYYHPPHIDCILHMALQGHYMQTQLIGFSPTHPKCTYLCMYDSMLCFITSCVSLILLHLGCLSLPMLLL